VRRAVTVHLVLALGLLAVLAAVTVTDLGRRVIPDAITAPAGAGAVAAALALDRGFVGQQLGAAAAAGGFFGVAALIAPRGMGMGDAKLAAVMGLYLGRAVTGAVLVALVAGALVGAAIVARRGLAEGRRATLPFAPFLALGGVAALAGGHGLGVPWG
jgi:leader peptidase (prepilin peptidase) / N-methyltransferase